MPQARVRAYCFQDSRSRKQTTGPEHRCYNVGMVTEELIRELLDAVYAPAKLPVVQVISPEMYEWYKELGYIWSPTMEPKNEEAWILEPPHGDVGPRHATAFLGRLAS